jgi:hypothetical protein
VVEVGETLLGLLKGRRPGPGSSLESTFLARRRLFPVNKIVGPATPWIRIRGVEDEFLGVFLGSSSR